MTVAKKKPEASSESKIPQRTPRGETTNPYSIRNRKYKNRITEDVKIKYKNAKQWLLENPKSRPKDACAKFEMSLTSFFKAKKILDLKTKDTKVKKDVTKKQTVKKEAPKWERWKFTEATIEKCKKAIQKQDEDASLSNGDIVSMFGISKASYYAYRKSIGLVNYRMPIKKNQIVPLAPAVTPAVKTAKTPKVPKTPKVQTIRYIPEDKFPDEPTSKRQGMVVVGDIDFITEFAKKLREM